MKKIVKIVAFRGNSGNSGRDGGRDGVLNFNHRGTGRGKMAGDLGERVPRVPLGIPRCKAVSMTQLLLHTFAHLTGPSFRVKAKLLPNNFFLGLV